MLNTAAFAVQRAPAAEMERTVVASSDESHLTTPAWASVSRPASSASQRRPSLSAVVTSAISDEEDDDDLDSDDYSEEWRGKEEEEEEEREHVEENKESLSTGNRRPRQLSSTQRTAAPSLQRRASATSQRGSVAPATRSRPSSIPTKSTALPSAVSSSSVLAAVAQCTDEVVSLSGVQWRGRLQRMRAEVMEQRYSRGERLTMADDSAFLDDEEDADTSAAAYAATGIVGHKSLSGSDLPVLSPFDRSDEVDSSPFSSTLDSAFLSSTARSTASNSAAAALKHSAFAKDREGMEQEKRELQREKRRLLCAIAEHEEQLSAVRAEFERQDARLLQLARQKGLVRVGEGTSSRFERRAETDDGRLNPALSSTQLIHSLQREVQLLEREKEERERRQDERDEEERDREERERAQRRRRGDGEDSDGVDAALRGMGPRRRLLAVRERKRQLLERIHAMQDQLTAGRQKAQQLSAASSRQSAASAAQLDADLRREQSHHSEYETQRRRAMERLDRSALGVAALPFSQLPTSCPLLTALFRVLCPFRVRSLRQSNAALSQRLQAQRDGEIKKSRPAGIVR